MNVILTCINPEQSTLLDEMCDEYLKFKRVEELPENVYSAFYWLSRYSGLVVRSPKEQGESAQTSHNTGSIKLPTEFKLSKCRYFNKCTTVNKGHVGCYSTGPCFG